MGESERETWGTEEVRHGATISADVCIGSLPSLANHLILCQKLTSSQTGTGEFQRREKIQIYILTLFILTFRE